MNSSGVASSPTSTSDPSRRRFIAGAALTVLAGAGKARADVFPDKPLRLIVPFAVGGAVTFLAEQVVKEMEGELGQSIIRDYRGGAGGTIAMEAAASAPHDGYTVFLLSTSQAISAGVYPNLKVDVVRDFEPVVLLAMSPYALVVHPGLPAITVPELVAYGKSHPGKLFQGTSGTGGSDDIVGHEFARISGTPVVYVPFRGAGPAVPELLAGRVNISFFSPLPTKAFVQQGKLRLLGVTTRQRSAAVPGVPTIAEQGYPDFDFPGWYGLAVPRGTPDAIVQTLQRATSTALAKASVKDFLAANGLTAGGGPSAEFKAFVGEETDRWSKLARGMGIQPE